MNAYSVPDRRLTRNHGALQKFSPAYLASRLRYEDGILYWRECEPKGPKWNARFAGKQVCHQIKNRVYWRFKLNSTELNYHRVVWVICTGAWPEGVIDHINHNPADNRIENLRDVTMRENSRSRRDRLHVPFPGKMHRSSGGFRPEMRVATRRCYLGFFRTHDEAEAARCGAEAVMTILIKHGLLVPGVVK